ncbi:MAG: AAA family ATPase, partial [Clostridia bacterium]|nr:AAA family ATPase [Clostridia bacterium]
MTPTNKQPLFIVTGASGVGKSTTCEELFKNEAGKPYLVLESDLLWDEDLYDTPEDNYRAFRSIWMHICANVSQCGKPVVLCGCALPEQFESLPEREFFTEIHYLAVVCDDAA